jgi:hypothetical protein
MELLKELKISFYKRVMGSGKKLEYSDVADKFLKCGCILLEKTYMNSHTPMSYRCKCGNISQIRYSNFANGGRCMDCSGNKKLKYSDVAREFLKGGCVLLEETYTNARIPMSYRCKCGNASKISYDRFRKGGRCAICGGNKKLKYSDVAGEFLKGGCIVLDDTYTNAITPMSYRCNCGNTSTITYGNFSRGKRCANCAGNKKLKYREVADEFLKAGCVLLEETYTNNATPMSYRCNCGNTSSIRYNNFINGMRCIMCKNKTERIVKDFLEEQYSNIISQPKFEWCKSKRCLPFDFLLEDFKIILEVDGRQHFVQVGNWGSPEENQGNDTFKTR